MPFPPTDPSSQLLQAMEARQSLAAASITALRPADGILGMATTHGGAAFAPTQIGGSDASADENGKCPEHLNRTMVLALDKNF